MKSMGLTVSQEGTKSYWCKMLLGQRASGVWAWELYGICLVLALEKQSSFWVHLELGISYVRALWISQG